MEHEKSFNGAKQDFVPPTIDSLGNILDIVDGNFSDVTLARVWIGKSDEWVTVDVTATTPIALDGEARTLFQYARVVETQQQAV